MQTPFEMKDRMHELAYQDCYINNIYDWLQQNKPMEISSAVVEIVPTDEVRNSRFYKALDIIYWYNSFVSVKIYRALGGMKEDEENEIQNDSNGSAKIAIIALSSLIVSWSIVMENMADHEDEILKFLIQLTDVRKHTRLTFPSACKFITGFDQRCEM